MSSESRFHMGAGFRRIKLRKGVQRSDDFYRAPELKVRGRTMERKLGGQQEVIGLGIDTWEEPSSEWQDMDDEMTDDPRIQDYSSRPPIREVRLKAKEVPRLPQLPHYGDPVEAIQQVLVHGGLLLRAGHDGLLRVTPEHVLVVREKVARERRREHEEKEQHERELDQFVATFERLQHTKQLEPDRSVEQVIAEIAEAARDFDGASAEVPNNDGAVETSPRFTQPYSSYIVRSNSESDSDGDKKSDTSVRTAIRERDGGTTPTPGKSPTSLALVTRPLPPTPTFPSSDFLLNSSSPDDHEEFISLNDPNITHHLARALHNIYSRSISMAAQNPAMANSAPYTLGGNMPAAGHHSDMQHIWSLVQELSQVLQQNRENYDELQEGLTRAQTTRPVENGVLPNGDANDSHVPHASPDADTSALQAQLSDALSRINELEAECKDANDVIDYAEDIVQKFKTQIQEYARNHQSATIGQTIQALRSCQNADPVLALHAHYNSLLETSRNETIQAQLTHQAWQASLMRLSEYLRLAQRAHEEGALPYRRRIAALKEENRILRAKAGWEPASESEHSDDEDDVFGEAIEAESS
ncbi:hypothetical protein E4T38_02623 [Aureobasidium subglaciale]|nr:hypothetical protein E4T38_02623 [Aureobasidium subglaciale]KAI5227549.1 hypothetical protein E4T40_02553 [Aureobasidium subglaciale]KAI5231063.1 hypothetical protein E4T41_02622 [Aureobasidium subglaciale]KAI5265236.1 hypothetical protein E4T46_02400 [Aureobasidium subglaciale]